MAPRLPPGASRVFHRAIDGTVPYFRSEGGMQEEGRLPEGADPAELLQQGYVEADRDSFLEARTRLDPLRPVPERPSQIGFHGPAGRVGVSYDTEEAMDAALAHLADGGASPESMEVQRQNEPQDVDALAADFDAAYAPGLARQQVALDAAMSKPKGPIPRGAGTGSRRPVYDVENVPSAVPLTSRLGGDPLPGPQRVAASPEAAPQQGPTFGEADTLEDAQKRERLMRGLGGVAGATSRMGYLIAGVKPPGENAAEAALTRDADTQVRDFLTRRQNAEAEKASALKAAESDPTSPASQRFQAMVSRAFGSVYAPEQIKGMTAADAPLVGKYGEMVRTLEDRAAGRAAEQESQQAQLAARATEAEKQRTFEGKQNAANRANAREIAGMRQETRETPEEREQRKIEGERRKLAERNVGGFEIDPANPPTLEGANKMASVVESDRIIQSSLAKLEALYNKHGSEIQGPDAKTMASEWMNITNALRMVNNMGVPNGADYLMLGKQIEDPTTLNGLTTRKASGLAQMKTLRDQVREKVAATAYAYKFKPTASAASTPAPTASGTPRRKKDKQGRTWEEGPDGEMRMVL